MRLKHSDIEATIKRYEERLEIHGYDPKTLGWTTGRQAVRFEALTSQLLGRCPRILDIGCGFGDLNRCLQQKFGEKYHYLGVDLVGKLLDEGRARFSGKNISFLEGDFLDLDLPELRFDYAIASGIFNHRLSDGNNYALIEATIEKALSLCNFGLAFDFLSDKVDYRLDHCFHSSPETVLGIAYRFSRNVIVRNDYMPFEFSLFIDKRDAYSSSRPIFDSFLKKHPGLLPEPDSI